MTSTGTAAASTTASSVEALTTTFTPPATCTENHLTILSSPGYEIWVNEPVPVSASTMSACYPSQFLEGYTSTSSSSVAPFFSALVCPDGWHTAMTGTSSYIACCPTEYELALPTTTVSPDRPAYGGTCYSNFASGQTVNVTAYNTASVFATSTWVASATGEQAYGHVIDGLAAYIPASSSANATTTTASTASSPTSTSSSSNSLSGGAIAGIVVGVCAAAILFLAAMFFFLKKRKQKRNPSRAEVDATEAAIAEKDASEDPKKGATELYSPTDTTELPSPQPMHELDGGGDMYPVEMGAGEKGHPAAYEMDGTGSGSEARAGDRDEKLPTDRYVQ